MIPNSMLYDFLTKNDLNLEASLNEYGNQSFTYGLKKLPIEKQFEIFDGKFQMY